MDLYLDDGIEVCGRQLEAYDAFVEAAFDIYSAGVPDEFRTSLHAVHSSADTPCGDGFACAAGGEAWVTQDLGAYHEISHTIQYHVDGRSLISLVEGTAEALGPLGPLAYRMEDLEALESTFLFDPKLTAAEYGVAAVFTRFLIDEYGADRFRAFFNEMKETSASVGDAYKRNFEVVFDDELETAWSTFGSQGRCAYDAWFCGNGVAATLPLEMIGMECDDPSVLGFDAPSDDDSPFHVEKIMFFDLAETQTLSFELSYVTAYLGKCGDCSEQVPVVLLASADTPGVPPIKVTLELDSGRHAMIVREKGPRRAELRVEVLE